MRFFTMVDPSAPSIEDRISDTSWNTEARLSFVRNTVRAVAELHGTQVDDEPILHRNLNPETILVKYDNTPILTGFDFARIPSDTSVASAGIPIGKWYASVAPEIQVQGLSMASNRSDVYSLCFSLSRLFRDRPDQTTKQALEVLDRGMSEQPAERAALDDLKMAVSELLGESTSRPPAPPARFWSEDQVVIFNKHDYRIVSRLGAGGVGITFKVVEIDRITKEDLGTYVAKVAHNEKVGQSILRAYSLARPHLGRHSGLSVILEVAGESHENEFISLMTWIEGSSLAEFTGVFSLLAEEQQEMSSEALALRWLRAICEALKALHVNGLIHGDISPRNMIVSGSDIVLTDYDFVVKIGEPISNPGTVMYCSPSFITKQNSSKSDDIYALAASFFHVVFDKEPFQYNGSLTKGRGLNWHGINRDEFPILAGLLDKATNPAPEHRFNTVEEVLKTLEAQQSKETEAIENHGETPVTSQEASRLVELHDHQVEWLTSLLQSYPGSRWGNQETRGLDSDFAAKTYVETNLEETLLRDIRNRRVRLVVLCGNAGDGKTALLQHVASALGLGKHPSSKRVLEGSLPDGLIVRMNLDGSAAWEDRSADELLDEFMKPFQQGPPKEDIVHMLAVNDGRLLEWLDGTEESPLTIELYERLQEEASERESHVRFISLNQRSLVGGITYDRKQIETAFLERLLDYLYGGRLASSIWAPCQSCTAKNKCEVFRAMQIFGPDDIIAAEKKEIRDHARKRLFEALQGVHLRGETHITVRELRAALVYILLGIHNCRDYHEAIEDTALPYWDRAFSPASAGRQGEVLRELALFDPALEAHPMIDRYLLSKTLPDSTKTAPHYDDLSLESARRRAYFEWTEKHIEEVAKDTKALGLARGAHLELFRELPMVGQDTLNLCERLCGGISRLEDLPPQSLKRTGVVPLRITPRTPTETAFWVEKKLTSFRVEAVLPPATEGVERLHRQAFLIYRYLDSREERLHLGAELFHLLLELNDGYQLGDISTDDTFAHLSIFIRRLIKEDERQLLAWNPMQDEDMFQVYIKTDIDNNQPVQRIVLTKVSHGGDI
ncbi:MAG: hypothetical protein HQK96_11460 [Nitrospirae bacterium]|nr:hypothetical protein [Nitrospirota bacterium]